MVQIDVDFGLDKMFTRNATPSVKREWRELPEEAMLGNMRWGWRGTMPHRPFADGEPGGPGSCVGGIWFLSRWRRSAKWSGKGDGASTRLRPLHPAFGHPLPASGARPFREKWSGKCVASAGAPHRPSATLSPQAGPRDQAVPVDPETAPAGAATHESLFVRESLAEGGWLILEMVHSLAPLACRSQKNQRKS